VTSRPTNASATAARLAACWPAALRRRINLLVASSLTSTQSLARRLVDRHLADDETPEPFAVVAASQTAGHGRRGRPWVSRAGLGVSASIALPVAEAEALQAMPLRAALALAETLSEWTGQPTRIKWPNDLLVGRRKLGGLLVDAIARADGGGWAIVGFGVNHGYSESELPVPGATSLALEALALPPLEEVANALLVALLDEVRELGARDGDGNWLERYRRASVHEPGDELECELGSGERLRGRFDGFDGRGRLRLDTPAGPRVVASGEVFS
jgi:BirA family biotin operon repressor/biotin-[acetyl-CoA-carboxylase] ligase